MPKIKAYHFGRVENGKLSLVDRPKFQCELNRLDGNDVRLVIERKPAQRKQSTGLQRRYYFAVICRIIADHVGISIDEAHDSMKAKFLSAEIEKDGYKFVVIRSTESLSTIEREDYHRMIREWASIDLGVYIPLPNEIEY